MWTKECNITFEELKKYLAHPPFLSMLEKKVVLYAYIAVINHAVSPVLVRIGSGVQKLIYYVRKSLQVAETQYLPLEKAILAIIHAMRKFPHYFQAHTVVALTQLPLQALLRRLDYTGRVAKLGTMLGEFDIKYLPV